MVGVAVCEHVRQVARGAEQLQKPDKHLEDRGGQAADGVDDLVKIVAPGGFPKLMDITHNLSGDSVQTGVLFGGEHHQGFLCVILKFPLCHKADRDLVPLIELPATDKPVQVGAHGNHPHEGRYNAVKHGGFVLRMFLIFLFDELKQLRHIQREFHINLGFGAFGHQVHHNVVQPVNVPDPASVLSIAKFTFHMRLIPLFTPAAEPLIT